MKRTSQLIYITLLLSCNLSPEFHNISSGKEDKTKRYATELIDNNFLHYADTTKMDSFKALLFNSFDIYEDGFYRVVDIDAEELSEFNFSFFLPNLNAILEKRNFKLDVQKLNTNETSHQILMNGDTIELYSEEELRTGTFEESASRIFFQKINELIKEKDSSEIFYLLYGGNDLHAILLTEKQAAIIAEFYKDEPKEIPYKP